MKQKNSCLSVCLSINLLKSATNDVTETKKAIMQFLHSNSTTDEINFAVICAYGAISYAVDGSKQFCLVELDEFSCVVFQL